MIWTKNIYNILRHPNLILLLVWNITQNDKLHLYTVGLNSSNKTWRNAYNKFDYCLLSWESPEESLWSFSTKDRTSSRTSRWVAFPDLDKSFTNDSTETMRLHRSLYIMFTWNVISDWEPSFTNYWLLQTKQNVEQY